MKKIISAITFISLCIIYSCTSNHCEEIPDTSNIQIEIDIERLDKKLSSIESKDELRNFISSNPDLKKVFSAEQFPNDSIFIEEFYRILSDAHTDTIFQDIVKVYGDFSDIRNELISAFKNIKFYFPDFKAPKIKTIASGFVSPDYYFSDSVIYIALDYFTGPQGHYPPPGEPDYIVKRYQKEYIVPTLIRIISTEFNAGDILDKTMLSEMIYWGKSYYFVNKILPCTHDSLIIGYSDYQLRVAAKNQERTWSHFVDKELLYETSHFIKTKYIGDRPYTAEISGKCPGRIGQWLGWMIVNKYMDEVDGKTTFQALMRTKSSQNIFNQSKFKPKNGEGL